MPKIGKKSKRLKIKGLRLKSIDSQRKEAKKQNKKPSSVSSEVNNDKSEKFLNSLFQKAELNNTCRHYLIGSSSFDSFLYGTYNFKRAHSILFTKAEQKVTGQSGEEAFIRSNSNIISKHPFGIHDQIPWMCATGDFVINEQGRTIIVEVKTFTEITTAYAAFENVSIRIIFQIWLQMDIFHLVHGRIVIYFLDRLKKSVTLIGSIDVHRKAVFFSKEMIILSTLRYVDFLREYFIKTGLFPSEDFLTKATLRMTSNIIRSSPTQIEFDENWKRRTLNRPFPSTCSFYDLESVESGLEQGKKIFFFEKMFKNHNFFQTSQKFKLIVFDEEFRREMTSDIFEKISKEKRIQVNDIEEKLNQNIPAQELISRKKLKRIRSLSMKKKTDVNEELFEKYKLAQFTIEKEKEKNQMLKEENFFLKKALKRKEKKEQEKIEKLRWMRDESNQEKKDPKKINRSLSKTTISKKCGEQKGKKGRRMM
jgi:hypothetical protein